LGDFFPQWAGIVEPTMPRPCNSMPSGSPGLLRGPPRPSPSKNWVGSRPQRYVAAVSTGARAADGGVGCFHVHHIRLQTLEKDDTLGILLHGTSVVGVRTALAGEAGWRRGDQIVEVNGRRVTTFDEFLDSFFAAQERGPPISFGVLRRHSIEEPGAGSEAFVDGFLTKTNVKDLAGLMREKFGAGSNLRRPPTPCSARGQNQRIPPRCGTASARAAVTAASSKEGNYDAENPYIQALKQRRQEFLNSSEGGWASGDGTEPLAAQLATRRSDALATLTAQPSEAWTSIFGAQACMSGCRCGSRCVPQPVSSYWCSSRSCMSEADAETDLPPAQRPPNIPLEDSSIVD